LAEFPENVIVEWAIEDWLVGGKCTWTEKGVPPAGPRRHIMRAHFASLFMEPLDNLAIDRIADLTARSASHGFDAISIFGERSPFNANVELNYLAFADCGSEANPTSDLSSFLDRLAAPLLGGPALAREYVEIARLIDRPTEAETGVHRARQIAAGTEGTEGTVARRWAWLANYVASHAYEAAEWGRCRHLAQAREHQQSMASAPVVASPPQDGENWDEALPQPLPGRSRRSESEHSYKYTLDPQALERKG
jgi:hypothetical protein